MHETPLHGFGLQAPFEQPYWHATSIDEYEQPLVVEQVPGDVYWRAVIASTQKFGGGVEHVSTAPETHAPLASH